MEQKKIRRTEADQSIGEAVRLYLHGFTLAGIQLTDPQLDTIKQTVRDLSMEYIESVYEVYGSGQWIDEILRNIQNSVVDYDKDKCVELCKIASDEDINPYLCVMEGLAAGMHTVSDLYEDKVYLDPKVLMCYDALYAGLGILRPLIPKGAGKVIGAVVIGVLEGDVHDIGKNLVKMMFDVAGWTVYDLGKDVEITKFAAEKLRTDAEMVALSAMMTTSMMGMPKVIKTIKERNPDAQIIIGGSPITEDTVGVFGANRYAPSAANAIEEAVKMIDYLRKLREERGSL